MFDNNELIGLTFEKAVLLAKQHLRTVRISSLNGEECILTQDYCVNRINVYVTNDTVIKIDFMG